MSKIVRIYEAGQPDVMRIEDHHLALPAAGEVQLEQKAIGVNYLDVTQRNGAVPIPLPGGLGLEGAGEVRAVGPGVDGFAVGDRVAYVLGPIGAYASARNVPADRLVKIPDGLSFDDAAAVLFKGLTAQYLLKSTSQVGPGMTVMIYGAAGPLGRIMVAWAKHLGARVIGVVSRESSVERARSAGCDDVLVWGYCDIRWDVWSATKSAMVDVVYDGVGRDTFDVSIDCLRSRGTMVSIGASSGAPEPVALSTLNRKSLFLTRPGLGAHISDIGEYRSRAADVFDAVNEGIIVPAIWRTFALEDVVEAHTIVEQGRSEGTIVLKP